VLVLHCTSTTCATHGCGAGGKDCGLGQFAFLVKWRGDGRADGECVHSQLGAERDVAGFTPCRIF
jgi:hypothetical protein